MEVANTGLKMNIANTKIGPNGCRQHPNLREQGTYINCRRQVYKGQMPHEKQGKNQEKDIHNEELVYSTNQFK